MLCLFLLGVSRNWIEPFQYFKKLYKKQKFSLVRDRDDLLDRRRDELIQQGIHVLNRTSIEDYLIHNEVLKKFADSNSLEPV